MAVPVPLGTPELMSMAAALGWASGLRLYAVLFLVGLAGHLGWVPLPESKRRPMPPISSDSRSPSVAPR